MPGNVTLSNRLIQSGQEFDRSEKSVAAAALAQRNEREHENLARTEFEKIADDASGFRARPRQAGSCGLVLRMSLISGIVFQLS
jgi:hypothetical protein